MYKIQDARLSVLLVHPGGPYWAARDEHAWSIPKGEPDEGEDLLTAAKREFKEETGFDPRPPFLPLAPCKQRGGKIVHCWAFQGDLDPSKIRSGHFDMEWPPHSGRRVRFPEVDRAIFFTVDEAKLKILRGQEGLIDELAARLGP
jgi:predicted NUDIX family NTP pyrophosphohydrolase